VWFSESGTPIVAPIVCVSESLVIRMFLCVGQSESSIELSDYWVWQVTFGLIIVSDCFIVCTFGLTVIDTFGITIQVCLVLIVQSMLSALFICIRLCSINQLTGFRTVNWSNTEIDLVFRSELGPTSGIRAYGSRSTIDFSRLNQFLMILSWISCSDRCVCLK
jgi:hypothetical protein